MLKAGLTGGIAAGKSHVLRRFAQAGFATVDLDTIARELTAPGGAAHAAVVSAFGAGIVAADGTIDRKALGALVFADPVARRRLEALLHPRIREAEASRLGSGAEAVAIVDAALLVETGQHLRFARLVVVDCEPREQLRRVMERDGLSEAAARARIEAQMPPAEKKRFAHFVIDNSGPREEGDAQADVVIAALRDLAVRPAPAVRVSAGRAAAALAAGPRHGPRGLSPWALVEEIAATDGLDLARLARRIDPAHDGPWYTLGALAADAPPETLAFPVALWSVARRPGDEPFTIAAAASVARLTHRLPSAISGAVVAALAAARVLEEDASSLARALPGWIAAATQWTGAPPSPSSVDVVTAAATHAAEVVVEPERIAQVARLLGHPAA